MKTTKISFSFIIIVFSIFFAFSKANSDNYFQQTGGTFTIPVYNSNANGHIKFVFSEILCSISGLDAAIISNFYENNQYTRYAYWDKNLGSIPEFPPVFLLDAKYYQEFRPDDYFKMKDIIFVKLRDGNYPNDIVILRGEAEAGCLQIHLNSCSEISPYPTTTLGGGNFLVTGGAFNSEDIREDVAVTTDDAIKIYTNNGNGGLILLEQLGIQNNKMRLKQMTDKNRQEIQDSQSDRADIIVYYGSNIRVYKNRDDNTIETTPFATFDVGFNITDFEVIDINGDEYNDIVVVGNNIGQVYLNNITSISQYPDWNVSGIGNSPLVTVSDINKDGFNDIITVNEWGNINVFVSPNLNTVNESWCGLCMNGFNVDGCFKSVDIINEGGIALAFSVYGIWENGFSYGIQGVKPTHINTNPPPPKAYKKYEYDNGVYRPRINLYNRGESDFDHYQIWKKKIPSTEFTLYANNITNDYFIDINEEVIFSGEDGSNTDNCFYYALSIDKTNYVSTNSNQIGYIVGIPSCELCGNDNSLKFQNNNKRDKFSISNFPNPFNPITKIVYSLPKDERITIIVYDVLGREITKLINNEYKKAGKYYIDFNASNLTSGIYFYAMITKNYRETKRMLLIK